MNYPASCRPAVLGLSLFLTLVATGVAAAPPAEKQKIESLISKVQGLGGAKFIRNGSEYDASTAARFLRGKWERNDAEIKSAQDFIAHAGTKSGTSGKPYLIRFKDGKQVACGDYLGGELKKLGGDKEAP